ncbi:MAG: hypothetical protein ACRDF4_09510 [Rhabdochlamydiaceae bacterium]
MTDKVYIIIAIVALLSMSAVLSTTYATAASPSISYNERYQRTGVEYTASSSITGSQIGYEIINGTYSGTETNNTVALTETNYAGTSTGGATSVGISVTSSYSASSDSVQVTVSGNGGTLLFASVTQSGETQLIWAGTAQIGSSASTAIKGLAYVNASQSASVILGFAGANSIQNVSANLGASASFALNLPRITFSETSTSKVNSQVNVIIPNRYSTLTINGASTINASTSIETPLISAGFSAFANGTYPDIVWQGNATSSISIQSTSSPATASARTAEFFGSNGTVVGYTQVVNLDSNHSLTLTGLSTNLQAYSSSTLIVSSYASPQTTGTTGIIVTIGGQPVVVRASSSGQIQSSANVQLQHQVTANGSSSYILVLLDTNSSMHSYFLINVSSNTATKVNSVTPTSESQTTITVNSKTYQATQVNITATSGNIVFNVSSSFSNIAAFKATASGMVQLSSSNYWEFNGQVYVFDDPSSTYYVANNAAGQATSSSSSSATGSTSLASQQSVTSASSESTTTSISSSGSTPPYETIAIAIIIIVLIILAAVVVLGRRKRTA